MSSLVRTLVGSLMLLATSLSVQAGETVKKKKVKAAPAAASSQIAKTAAVEPFNPFMIRLRAIAIAPDSSAKVYAGGAQVAGASLHVSNSYVPEVDVSYFFTPNLAVEAICCVAPHTVKGSGALAGTGNLGDTLLFPPTVLAQYHITDFGAFKPYVGVGVNYTHFFKNGGAGPNYAHLSIKDSWGVAGQIGFDYMIDKHWGINFDVKKIMMEPNATVTLLPATAVTAKVKINPWIVGTGLTYKF